MKGVMSRGKSEEGSLMLTPLLDMFTIILIFLIVSFNAQDKGFEPNREVDLPESRARSVLKAAVDIAITPDELTVEQERTVGLDDGEFDQTHYDAEQIPPLVEKLEAYYKKIQGEEIADEELADPETDEPILLVQADRELDYRSLYLVLRSGALAGFTKYRLAISKN